MMHLMTSWTFSFTDANFDTTKIYDLLGPDTAQPCGFFATYSVASTNPLSTPISVDSLGVISASSVAFLAYPV